MRFASRASAVLVGTALAMLAGCSLFTDLGGFANGTGDPASDAGTSSDAPAFAQGGSDGRSEGGSEGGSAPSCTPTGTVETVVASPGTVTDDPRIGTVPWNLVDGAKLPNDTVEARSGMMSGQAITHWLVATNYGITLPPNAIVRGFVVGVRRAAGSADEIADHGIALVKDGVIGTPKSKPAPWPVAMARSDYGAPGDLWGQPWTAADVSSPTFGVAVAAKGVPAYSENAYVDHIELTVHLERCQ